jgi:uncharacterized membrane protein
MMKAALERLANSLTINEPLVDRSAAVMMLVVMLVAEVEIEYSACQMSHQQLASIPI